MKIVQYLDRFDLTYGGVVRAVLDLCAGLVQRGHEISLLTQNDADVPQEWRETSGQPNGVPRLHVLHRSWAKIPRLDRKSLEIVRGAFAEADAIHLHVPWDPVNLQLGKLAQSLGKPYVLSIHGMLDDWTIALKGTKKRAFLALGGRRLLEQALAVHCTAQAEKDQSERWYPRGRSAVIPLLFDLKEFEALPGAELAREKFPAARVQRPIVLFVGRMNPIKRVDLLIKAAAELRRMGQPFQLLLAGPPEKGYEAHESELHRLVRQEQLENVVHFIGFVSGREKVSLYEAASVFVLPSRHENFGFVSVEALACRVPVVATKGVNIWPELAGSGGAKICELDASPAQLAEAIAGVLRDPAEREAMGDRGRRWVFDVLDPGRVAAAYESMYRGAS